MEAKLFLVTFFFFTFYVGKPFQIRAEYFYVIYDVPGGDL